LSNAIIFSTHFPSVDDLKLIIATGISKLYFYGKIDNPEAVDLMNNLKPSPIPLEIFQLE